MTEAAFAMTTQSTLPANAKYNRYENSIILDHLAEPRTEQSISLSKLPNNESGAAISPVKSAPS